ncbi:MAG: hypothetical protein LBB56_00735 [Chitinispirillales bacterium]|jgi:hypothetical protein|nr:hypothetical protein [Chitinispirillales bacterium]
MKVLVLDDKNKKNGEINGLLDKKKIDGALCSTSNEFLNAVELSKFDTLVINAQTRCRGRAIYDYFDIGKKIESKRVVFYNAEEKFAGISGRKSVDQDKIHYKPVDLETVFSN